MNANINETFATQALVGAFYSSLWLMFLLGFVLYGLEWWRRQKRRELFSGQRHHHDLTEEQFLSHHLSAHQTQNRGGPLAGPSVLTVAGESPAATTLEPPREQTAPAADKSPPPPPQRILLVDDDAYIREILSEMLKRSGYRVDTAEDGEAGWKMLDTPAYAPDSYDLLVTDNQMPNLTGVELIKRLRSERKTLPVILASGTAPHDTESLQPGVLLRKPFTPEQLVQTVKQVLPPV